MLKINSKKLYHFIEEELDEREREIIAKRTVFPIRMGVSASRLLSGRLLRI